MTSNFEFHTCTFEIAQGNQVSYQTMTLPREAFEQMFLMQVQKVANTSIPTRVRMIYGVPRDDGWDREITFMNNAWVDKYGD